MRELSYFVFPADDAALRQVVRRHFQNHFLTRRQAGRIPPGLALEMRQYAMSIGQFDPVHPARQRFHYRAFNFDGTRSGHVKISGSDSVTSTVCSK